MGVTSAIFLRCPHQTRGNSPFTPVCGDALRPSYLPLAPFEVMMGEEVKPAVRQVVVIKGLGEDGVDGRSHWIAADRPLVIKQYADHPMSRCDQEYGRWSNRNLPVPRTGSLADGMVKTGPTPQMSARMRRGTKQ